jgi:hypothetical protein
METAKLQCQPFIKMVKTDEALAVLGLGSGDEIMLTSLSQFQAQGWEKWLSRIRFAVQPLLSKIIPIA